MHPIGIIQDDPYLQPFENQIRNRIEWFENTLKFIEKDFGSLEEFASAHHFFGFHYDEEKKGWWFREWLPNAHAVYLIGDFNDWNRGSHPLEKGEFGTWQIFLSDDENALQKKSKFKIVVHGNKGIYDRLPPYVTSVIQKEDNSFDGLFLGQNTFQWKNADFKLNLEQPPLIYEAHIGMAQEEEKVGTYKEFTENVLPRIKEAGYNCVQLMAIQEHPYYGSFGYQVSNFFAPSSRFGTPDDLKNLIDTAHGLGIAVILDVVHSHSVKNLLEGLAEIDGTEQYFSGWHPDWDSRLFDYGKVEVKRFLLSNLKYWIEEFKFDGFRFDGVTSMFYHHFGHVSFSDYQSYFNQVNHDALLYLQLANHLIKKLNPNCISICEDMSGMPGACRPIASGGIGFDYRLNMGLPDFWIKTLETKQDEDWHMGDMFWQLSNRRDLEKNIGYCESHDQALVGDKTIIFWLMDKEMYTGMSVFNESLVVDRGIALHKLIRFVTIALGGEGYMNFIGNEFGHPEWVDFPREGNGWSHKYARRQWSLQDTDHLKYKFLAAFDKAMLKLVKEYNILQIPEVYKLHEDNNNKVLVFSKNNLLFLFNFGQESLTDFQFYPQKESKFQTIFSSDDKDFGGFDRVDKSVIYETNHGKLSVYLPNRSVLVLKDVLI